MSKLSDVIEELELMGKSVVTDTLVSCKYVPETYTVFAKINSFYLYAIDNTTFLNTWEELRNSDVKIATVMTEMLSIVNSYKEFLSYDSLTTLEAVCGKKDNLKIALYVVKKYLTIDILIQIQKATEESKEE